MQYVPGSVIVDIFSTKSYQMVGHIACKKKNNFFRNTLPCRIISPTFDFDLQFNGEFVSYRDIKVHQ